MITFNYRKKPNIQDREGGKKEKLWY